MKIGELKLYPHRTIPYVLKVEFKGVAANYENDACFGNGLVTGSADCIDYAGLVKTLHSEKKILF